jgi:hypothetical protein
MVPPAVSTDPTEQGLRRRCRVGLFNTRNEGRNFDSAYISFVLEEVHIITQKDTQPSQTCYGGIINMQFLFAIC